jgi:hypothetical protein
VAITNKFPEARSVFSWLKSGWHIAVAYILGFFVLLFLWGWEPEMIPKKDSSGHAKQPMELLVPATEIPNK